MVFRLFRLFRLFRNLSPTCITLYTVNFGIPQISAELIFVVNARSDGLSYAAYPQPPTWSSRRDDGILLTTGFLPRDSYIPLQ